MVQICCVERGEAVHFIYEGGTYDEPSSQRLDRTHNFLAHARVGRGSCGGTYRGIGAIYFTIIGAILIYGVNDAFGKKAMYIAAPIIVIGLYLLLPPGS